MTRHCELRCGYCGKKVSPQSARMVDPDPTDTWKWDAGGCQCQVDGYGDGFLLWKKALAIVDEGVAYVIEEELCNL